MDYDCILSLIPPYTVTTPSIGIASLYSFLKDKNFKVYAFDFCLGFYKKFFKKLKIHHNFPFRIPQYPLLGYTLWLYESEKFFYIKKIGEYIIRSLSPIHYDLYSNLFNKQKERISLFDQIIKKYIDKLLSFNTEIYAFSINITNAISTLKVISEIKKHKPEVKIIIGGPEAFPIYRCYLYANLDIIDFVIYHYEGELPLYYLLKIIKNNESFNNLRGVLYKSKSDMKINRTPPPLSLDLNKLPNFDYDEIDYYDIKFDEIKKLDLLTSKGCQNNCVFCNEPIIWNKFTYKSPQKLYREIKYYINKFGISDFEISDNAFNNTNNLLKSLSLLDTEGYKIRFGGNCKINRLNLSDLKRYKSYGLTHCYYGLESASQKILNLMHKNLNIEYASKIIKNTSKLNIEVLLYFIVGFPFEYDDDFQKNLEFLLQYRDFIDDIYVSVFTFMNEAPISNSDFIKIKRLGPDILNCFIYESNDGITNEIRKNRYIKMRKYWEYIKNKRDIY